MALDTAALKTAVENAFAAAHGQGLQPEEQTLAQALASAIDAFVKSGDVNTAGLVDSAGDALVDNTNVT